MPLSDWPGTIEPRFAVAKMLILSYVVPIFLSTSHLQVQAMSISSQPFTRQASLQRSRSTVLASAALDALFEPKGSHTLQQPLYPNPQAKKPCLSGISPLQQVCESTTALLTQQDAGLDLAKQCAKPAALSLQCPSGNPDAVLKQGSGLLPALASKIAEQLQTKRNGVQANPSSSSSGPAEQSFSVQLPSVSANPESTVTYKLHQNSAVSNSVQVSDAFAAAMADAAQLTAEISSFKAGQSAGREKTHLAAAARQTAHTVCSYTALGCSRCLRCVSHDLLMTSMPQGVCGYCRCTVPIQCALS